MVATLALALLLNGPVEPRLTVHLSIDQSGGLAARQLQLAVDEVRKIWSDAHVAVTSGGYGEPSASETGWAPSRSATPSSWRSGRRSRRWLAFKPRLSSNQSLTAWSGSAFV